MTYGKLSDRCLKVFVVLLIAGVLGGFCLPHFVEAVAGGYNTRAVGMSLGAEGLAAPVLSVDFHSTLLCFDRYLNDISYYL